MLISRDNSEINFQEKSIMQYDFLNLTDSSNKSNTTLSAKSMIVRDKTLDVVTIASIAIASIGIIANSTVVVPFVNNRKLRLKIPNIFIVNQVSSIMKCL